MLCWQDGQVRVQTSILDRSIARHVEVGDTALGLVDRPTGSYGAWVW